MPCTTRSGPINTLLDSSFLFLVWWRVSCMYSLTQDSVIIMGLLEDLVTYIKLYTCHLANSCNIVINSPSLLNCLLKSGRPNITNNLLQIKSAKARQKGWLLRTSINLFTSCRFHKPIGNYSIDLVLSLL